MLARKAPIPMCFACRQGYRPTAMFCQRPVRQPSGSSAGVGGPGAVLGLSVGEVVSVRAGELVDQIGLAHRHGVQVSVGDTNCLLVPINGNVVDGELGVGLAESVAVRAVELLDQSLLAEALGGQVVLSGLDGFPLRERVLGRGLVSGCGLRLRGFGGRGFGGRGFGSRGFGS